MVLYSNNAKLCYNRIVYSIASIAMQRLEMSLIPIKSIFKTIQKINHIVRTEYGNSTSFINENSEDKPYQGILQENGSGPIA